MRSIFLIAKNTLRIVLRKKGNIVLFILSPVLIITAMMFLFGNASTGVNSIGIYNEDKGILGKELVSKISSIEKFNVVDVKAAEINDLVSTQKVDCVITLPTNFSEKLYNGESIKLDMKTIKGEDTTIWIENFTNIFVENLKTIGKVSNGSKEVFNQMLVGLTDGDIKLTIGKVEDVSNSRSTTSASIGFLIMFMMYATTVTSSMIIKEKQEKTFYRVQSAPVNSRAMVMGNILANIAIVALQSILVSITVNHILKMNSGIDTIQLIIVLITFGLVSVSLGMMIISFSNSTAQTGNLTTLITTPTCMLGGCFWPVTFMPKTLQKISDFMPQRWALKSIESLQTGTSLSGILINLAVLGAFALVFCSIAAYRFKINKNLEGFI